MEVEKAGIIADPRSLVTYSTQYWQSLSWSHRTWHCKVM